MNKEKKKGRRSKDNKVNEEGRFLVEALEEAGWWIFNEEGKRDEERGVNVRGEGSQCWIM